MRKDLLIYNNFTFYVHLFTKTSRFMYVFLQNQHILCTSYSKNLTSNFYLLTLNS